MTTALLSLKGVTFSYRLGEHEHQVLQRLDMTINRGEMVAIQGPSGSGKSTLFYIIGCLLRPTSGEIVFNGQRITDYNEEELAFFRNRNLGFVFQQFHLLPRATVLDNIMLPAKYPAESASPDAATVERAKYLAERLGLAEHLNKPPNQLSGGQQQRVAIARALMHDVDLILADEPTGNLDSKNAEQVLELFKELNAQGKTIVLITHDHHVAEQCQKVFHFKDGAIVKIDQNDFTPAKTATDLGEPKAVLEFHNADPLTTQINLMRSALPLVWANIMRNRTKSMLTMLGVVIGVAAVLAMISLGQFTKHKVLEGYEAMGVNKLEINGWENWRMRAIDAASQTPFRSFSWDKDLLPMRNTFSEIKLMSPMVNGGSVKLTFGGQVTQDSTNVIGINEQMFAIINSTIALGRNLSQHHVQYRARVCVAGAEVANLLNIAPPSALLEQTVMLTIDERISYPCKIIGILKKQSGGNERSPDKLLFMPYTSLGALADSWNSRIRHVVLKVDNAGQIEDTGKKIVNFFKAKYGKSGNFSVDNDAIMLAQMKRFLNIFAILLAAIAFLSLLVGGIGIHNMMLVSVADRLKEIGLRKAIGATSRSIRILFLSESIVLCAIAGIIGVIIGTAACQLGIWAATKFVNNLKFEWVFEPAALLLSFFAIGAVGIVSGLVPAIKAEKLQVIEALRSE